MTATDSNLDSVEAAFPLRKRRLLLGATAASAALLGVGVAWLRNPLPDVEPVTEPLDGFWSMQWDTPQGGKLAMQTLRGRPLLLNFWATWCAPCVEELPLINDFYLQNKSNGWQVLGLAIDKLAPVQAFLQKKPLDFSIGMAGLAGADLVRGLGNAAGGLPFSVVFGANGAVLHRKMGRLHADDLSHMLSLK